jgi:hypothetical protein
MMIRPPINQPNSINYPYNTQKSLQNKPLNNSEALPLNSNKISAGLDDLITVYGEKKLKVLGIIPCTTCSSRLYQDGSDDPGVSFKTPTHISPEASHGAVMSHEMEHVANEQVKAENEQREVVSQSVILHAALCPECGKSYIAGGVTTTITKAKNREYDPSIELLKGAYVNGRV